MSDTQRKIDALQEMINKDKWFGRKPFGPATMSEAVEKIEANPNLTIALISWWQHAANWLPAGWTWLEVLEDHPDGYRVMMDTEPQKRENFIPLDEIVMIFHTDKFANDFEDKLL